MRILFIEPDSVLSNTYKQALIGGGHEVVSKANAQSAVDALNIQAIDLIILEIQMASHNGLEFLHELRSYGEWQDLPVIILTLVPRNSFTLDNGNFKDLGIRDYLYKPITTNSLLLESIEKFSPQDAWKK